MNPTTIAGRLSIVSIVIAAAFAASACSDSESKGQQASTVSADTSSGGDASAAASNSLTLIGRCSYDNQTSEDNHGGFRSGYAIANFYRSADDGKLVVAHGMAMAEGSIFDKLDKLGGKKIDQGTLWPVYDVSVTNQSKNSNGVSIKGSWVDALARQVNPSAPKASTFVYVSALGQLDSRATTGSFVQNYLGQANAYPNCVFWDLP